MDPVLEAYLAFVELALLLVVPMLVILTVFSWWLAWQTRPYKLAYIIAIKNTIIVFGAGWLAWTVLYRSRIGPVPTEFLPVTATAILALCITPFLTTIYLVWLRARQVEGRAPRRRVDDEP
jgi:hypothetical protein